MGVAETDFATGFIKVAQTGWEQGWHERNGGNLSYRLTAEDIDEISDVLKASPAQDWMPIGWDAPIAVPGVAGDFFMITGAGKYFQDIASALDSTTGIIEVDGSGANYRIRWGFEGGGRPSSELPTHLMNHEIKKGMDENYRVIYHAHPANIIALTFVLDHSDSAFIRELWAMISECAMVFPAGVGVVDWFVPGGKDIALASAEVMRRCDVAIWVHHGMFCAGKDFAETFGLMHTVEKAAEIAVKVRSMGVVPSEVGITQDNLCDLADSYDLNLRSL